MTQYEFSNDENLHLFTFLQRLNLLSTALLITGVVLIIEGAIPAVSAGDIITGIVFLVIGGTLYLPVNSFQTIIVTEGNDMDEFTKGFNMLNFIFGNVIIGAFALVLLTAIISYFQNL